MNEIKIDGEEYFIISDVAKQCGFSEKTLKQYVKIKKIPSFNRHIVEIGKTKFVSQKGIDVLKNYRKNSIAYSRGEEITLGGKTFKNKADAAHFFGFPPEDLSRYLRVKKAIEEV